MRNWLLPALACILLQAGMARAAEPPGVASCSGCHAISKAVDTPVPRLFGRKADELATAMREYKAGTRPGTIMGRLAKGFSDEEIAAICDWFAGQPDK